MASTNKTPRLGLSQWVLSDPFRMEDFNNDNAKLDALSLVKLGEVVTSQSCQQIDLDVSGIEWEKYLMVKFYWQLHNERASDENDYFIMRANGFAGDNYLVRDAMGGFLNCRTANYLINQEIKPSETLGRWHYFETLAYPQFDGAVFYTKDLSLTGGDSYYHGGIVKTSASDKTPLPLAQISTLNFICFNYNASGTTPMSFVPGSRFLVYGVTK